MQIKKLEIYGYGKWVDQSFDLNEGLQIFLGANEAGKSTLMSFIHSILFGFPTRSSTFLRYEPQESSKYGGRIIAEDSVLGEVIIERVHGKVTGDVTVTLEDGATGTDELLDKLLKGLSRENFQSIFSFSLSEIENVHQLDKNKLSRYLLNIGAHSTDYYLDLVDEFQKSAYDLYRPSGRIPPLNKELTKITAQEKKLEQLEKRNQSYLALTQKYAEQNEQLEKNEQREKKIQDQLAQLQEFKKEWHVLKEIQTLKKEINQIELPILKDDGHYLLEEYKKELQTAAEHLEKLKVEIAIEKEKFLDPDLIEKYEENKKEIINLEQDLPEMVEKIGQLEAIGKEVKKNEEQILELKKALQIDKQTALPSPFSTQEKQEIQDWLNLTGQADELIESLSIEIQELEYTLNLKNQKADQYEEMMWENESFKEMESQITQKKASKPIEEKSSSQLIPAGLGIVGLLVIIASFWLTIENQWLVAGIGAIVFLLSLVLYRRKAKTTEKLSSVSSAPDSLLLNEFQKQLALREDWQSLLGEIDGVQVNYQAKIEEKNRLVKEQVALAENWMHLLRQRQLPSTHLLADAERVIEKTEHLVDLEELNDEDKKQVTQLTADLHNKLALLDEILLIDPELSVDEKMNQFRLYLKELNQLLQIEETKMEQLRFLKEKEKQLLEVQEVNQQKITLLFETSGVQTEEDFLALYKQKEQLDQKKSRVQFLKENAPAFDADKKLPSKEELAQQEEKLIQQLQEESKKNRKIINQRANTQVNIENLEKDGSYSEALQEFENQKAITQHLVDEWISDKIAAAIIQSTLNQVTKERFEEIITEINGYFNLLTSGEYENILFKEEELFVQKKDGSIMEVKALSRGTAEPLYVAIRLAYIVKMQDVIQLPVIMDDPFVNFDQTRKENIYRLLDQLSDKLQIIYFSFDTDLKQEFHENQLIDLENYK